jgi:hypothetical protein
MQYLPRYVKASVATVVGPRGLVCINLSVLSCLALQRTPDSGAKGIGALFRHARPPFPGSLSVPQSQPVVCEEDGPKWSATRREEKCSKNTPER